MTEETLTTDLMEALEVRTPTTRTWRQSHNRRTKRSVPFTEKRDALRAENERLREALRRIVCESPVTEGWSRSVARNAYREGIKK